MSVMSRLERKLRSATTKEVIFQMVRTREVFQYDITDVDEISRLVSVYTGSPADFIKAYIAVNAACCAQNAKKALETVVHNVVVCIP